MGLFALPAAVAVWLASCDTPNAAQDEFWRPWYDTADGAAPPDSPPDLRSNAPSDLRSNPPPDLYSGRLDGGTPDLSNMADMTTTPTSCSLAVSVTTITAGGRYGPRNIGAIWVSDNSDHFIKTLNVWADKRSKYLTRWNAATSAASLPANRTDAISGATKTSHGVRTATWNCKDTKSVTVSDGSYKVCFELTEADSAGPYDCIAFSKSPTPFSLTPANVSSFTARTLELTP
jgi:hypothetical protein